MTLYDCDCSGSYDELYLCATVNAVMDVKRYLHVIESKIDVKSSLYDCVNE